MTSASQTVVALETDSAWVVIIAVSLVTFAAVLILRKIIDRPGGLASGTLLSLPLVLPLVAAIAYQHSVLPEVAVMRSITSAALESRGSDLLHLLYVSRGEGDPGILYALSGSPGPWLLLIGLSVSSFMLLRRLFGTLAVQRMVRRCRPLGGPDGDRARRIVGRLMPPSRLVNTPEVLLLPPGVSGAFAMCGRRCRILLSEDLLESLEPDELEAVIAHEMAHLAARDVPLLFAAGFLRDVVAWNPIAHLALRRLAADREYEADRRAAAWTGSPLTVASSLLKVWDVMGRRMGMGQRLAVNFLTPGGRVARRVHHLIALSDGHVITPRQTAKIPYVAAACLAAVLGLQAGAKLAHGDTSALAFMLGSPEAVGTTRWRGDADIRALKAASAPAKAASVERGTKQEARRMANWRLFSKLDGGLALWERDLPAALDAMKEWVRRQDVAPASIGWVGGQGWRAEPLIAQTLGPVGVYRMELQPLLSRGGWPPSP